MIPAAASAASTIGTRIHTRMPRPRLPDGSKMRAVSPGPCRASTARARDAGAKCAGRCRELGLGGAGGEGLVHERRRLPRDVDGLVRCVDQDLRQTWTALPGKEHVFGVDAGTNTYGLAGGERVESE